MRKLLTSFALATIPTLALAQQAPAITGAWDLAANIAGMPIAMKCALTQKDAVISGTCTSDQGTQTITGKVQGKDLVWQFDAAYEGQTLTVVYSGAFETADKIVGSVDVQPMNVGGDFTATRTRPQP